MNTNFERNGTKSTVEWYTPKYIIESLGGSFDLDPATCQIAMGLNFSAKRFYTKEDNGLEKEWKGCVFLNPPYSNPEIAEFMKKLSEHGDGIALVYNRADSKWFQNYVFDKADAMMFLSKRIRFIRPDGTEGKNPGTGSILIAYGKEATKRLQKCELEGKLVFLKQEYYDNKN